MDNYDHPQDTAGLFTKVVDKLIYLRLSKIRFNTNFTS